MYCQNCGKKISKDSKFCPYCGHPQTNIKNNSNTYNYRNSNNNFHFLKNHLVIMVGIIIIICVLIYIPIHHSQRSQQSIETNRQLSKKGNSNIMKANRKAKENAKKTATKSGATSYINDFYHSDVWDASQTGVKPLKHGQRSLDKYGGNGSASNDSGAYFYAYFVHGKKTPGYNNEVNRINETYKFLSMTAKRNGQYKPGNFGVKDITYSRLSKSIIKLKYTVYYKMFDENKHDRKPNHVSEFKGSVILKKDPGRYYGPKNALAADEVSELGDYVILNLQQSRKPFIHFSKPLSEDQKENQEEDDD